MASSRRLRAKLLSLNYPAAQQFAVDDIRHVRNLIVWLEDRVIRVISADQRLRDIDSGDWAAYMKKYLDILKCPFSEDEPAALVDWVIGKALLLDFKTEDSTPATPIPPQSSAHAEETGPEDDIFANIDVYGPEFKNMVTKLAHMLQIPSHPDPLQMFKAACLLIENKLSAETIEKAVEDYGRKRIDELKSTDVCLGFEVTDPDVRAAAVALRLLNVNQMRRLQDQANAAIVQVQKLTADPKTDERLGKVGF
ncbi:unnamed protein product [Calicophoron daubneyi]|uniref:RNA transcription, translation and transport factor protein n=1 Tax=Calicophoron daubneyi TaxID=300641 RepID=A0AAV2T9D2_CALDB